MFLIILAWIGNWSYSGSDFTSTRRLGIEALIELTRNNDHDNYGLSYPATYQFGIPSTAVKLKAYKGFGSKPNRNWIHIPERKTSDFFNGIEAVRFDYVNDKAYISVPFDSFFNYIYIKIEDSTTNEAYLMTFDSISTYYDARDAVVAISGDDWHYSQAGCDSFMRACNILRSESLWFNIGIITCYNDSYPNWDSIQSQINASYVEPASHSQTHSVISDGRS